MFAQCVSYDARTNLMKNIFKNVQGDKKFTDKLGGAQKSKKKIYIQQTNQILKGSKFMKSLLNQTYQFV